MRGTYILPMRGTEVDAPPFRSDGGVQLHYIENGVLKGGFSCVSVVPGTETALVLIDAPQATHDWLTVNRILVEVLSDVMPT